MLVDNGKNVAPGPDAGPSYFFGRNPRTGIGINAGCADTDPLTQCKVFFVTVDGRQPGWSIGMNLVQFAQEFINLGAKYAINLESQVWALIGGTLTDDQRKTLVATIATELDDPSPTGLGNSRCDFNVSL